MSSLVERAQSSLPEGESLAQCEKCGAAIPLERREALPGVRFCVRCQAELE